MYFGFKNITIRYGDNLVLDDITIDVPKNNITTIIGPNGCGKSSLLKYVARNKVPKNGMLIYDDRSFKEYDSNFLAKKIAYLPQIHKSPTDATVRSLVANGRYPYKKFFGGLGARDIEVIEEVLRFTGLKEIEERSIKSLSGGERQRAWLALTMATEPDIMVLDEPTTYLDICYQLEVMDLIKKMQDERGMTILLVLHDINLAAKYSDYIVAIKDRKIYQNGRVEEVINEEMIKDVFGVDAKLCAYDNRPYLLF
ncbi:MAG: ABC transporter ATP-binding protein [Ezakiella sp.]|nr:ABC transporter ATP-binding protein [Ezakiella sp.]MDD7761421.1 ABC transporter ATP-binding protein [Bacillota bacterium]MDY3946488.1 ABC transporter ATP-binding protein [Ezakiella sp.]